MAEFCWPRRTADAELASLVLQAGKHKLLDRPTNLEEIKMRMLPKYLRFDLHPSCKEFNAELIKERLEWLVEHVNRDASPGLPWAVLGKTNAQLIDHHKELLIDICVRRIKLLSDVSLSDLYDMTAEERILKGYNDPSRMFVKDEPHKRTKVQEGRNRIIMSVSIADKLIQMYMRKFIHDLGIKNWKSVPNKPGISFDAETNKWMWKHVTENFQCSTDVSGFDFSYQEWDKEFEVDLKIALCNDPTPFWKHLMHASRICLSNIVLSTSDGRLFKLTWKGLLLSGEYLTGECNSTVRNMKAEQVGSGPSESMGDDCVEQAINDPYLKYAEIGITLKVCDPITDTFEFCSRIYTRDKSWLVNDAKLLMNLVHANVSTGAQYRSALRAFEQDMADHPNFTKFMQDLEKVGFLRPDWKDDEILVEDEK